MSDTRRAFVKRSATAAVGATMIGALLATEADARYVRTRRGLRPQRRDLGHDRRARGHRPRPQARRADRPRGEVGGNPKCHRIARRRRSARTRSPTTPTRTRSSARRPEHGHDHLELPAARGAVRRPELLRVRRRRPLRDPHRQRRRRRAGDHLRVPVPDRGPQPGHVPLQHRPDRLDRQPELEPAAVLHGHAREERPPQGAGERPRLPAVQHRAGLDAATTRSSRRRRFTRSAAATPCSPGSAWRGSTSTSARSSTSATCGRSRTCTWAAMAAAHAVNATHDFSVHTIALKIPKHELTRDGSKPTDPMAGKSVIGVWTAASRRRASVRHAGSGTVHEAGPWVQVSRLGNPLFNEVIVPLGDKDRWNALPAQADAQFLHYVAAPRARRAAAGAVSGRVPQPGQADRAAGRPGRDPDDRHPGRHRAGLPELHRQPIRPISCG